MFDPTTALRPLPRRGRGTRSAIILCFWAGMVGSVALWWFNTPAGSIEDLGTAMIEAGRITGMAAGYVLLVQVLMMSRVGWLDRKISANDLLGAHRDLGFALVVFVLLHLALTLVGYAKLSEVSIAAEATTFLTEFEDMVSATVATGILVGVGLVSIRAIRSRMRYEVWHFLHFSTYVVLLLSYGHQFAVGRELAADGPATWVWAGGYYFVIACLIQGRVLAPLRFNLRHRLRVADVVAESADVISIYIDGCSARRHSWARWRRWSSVTRCPTSASWTRSSGGCTRSTGGSAPTGPTARSTAWSGAS